MTLFHESYREQSRQLQIALAILWCHTMICAQLQVEWTNKHVRLFALLWSFTFSRATIGRLCTIPSCYWSNYFGCFRQYKNPGQDVSRINGTYGHHIYRLYKGFSAVHCYCAKKLSLILVHRDLTKLRYNKLSSLRCTMNLLFTLRLLHFVIMRLFMLNTTPAKTLAIWAVSGLLNASD